MEERMKDLATWTAAGLNRLLAALGQAFKFEDNPKHCGEFMDLVGETNDSLTWLCTICGAEQVDKGE